MKKLIFVFFLLAGFLSAQTFKAEKVEGKVKALLSSNENWVDVKNGMELNANAIVVTEKNSSIQLNNKSTKFSLKESSALSLSDLKKMSLDDLILGLAMENIMNVKPKKEINETKNTAVYGTKVSEEKVSKAQTNNFGIKRLNGIRQLAENGYEGSAVIAGMEVYRKYPQTKSIPSYRILFANILFDKGLYQESYDEFSSIKNLELKANEKTQVENKLNVLSKKIISSK